MKTLVTFNEIKVSDKVGMKAFNLTQLSNAGFNVPEGVVVPIDVFDSFINKHREFFDNFYKTIDENDNPALLKDAIEKFHDAILNLKLDENLLDEGALFLSAINQKRFSSVAVRSSGNYEDASNYSFAGQYETILNVRTKEELEKAILECWASVFNERVVIYCKEHKLPHRQLKLGVLIQVMIPSEKSGILFSVDPLTGNDKTMVIEAIHGLGEALVGGMVDPDIIHFNWYSEKAEIISAAKQEKKLIPFDDESFTKWQDIENKTLVLDEQQILNLGNTALQIQQFYGSPQDIEWAIFHDELFILQSRPLTSIHFSVEDEWTNADFKDGGDSSGVATPLKNSLYEYIFESTMPKYFSMIHILPKRIPKKWYQWYFGYPYWNMRAIKEGAKKIPGFIERKFDQSMGIEPDYSGEGYRTRYTLVSIFDGLRTLLAINKSLRRRPRTCRRIVIKAKRITNDFNRRDFTTMSDEELLKYSKNLILNDYLTIEGGYFDVIYDNSNANTLFHKALEKYNKKAKEKLNYLNLVGGLQGLSHLRPMEDLWSLSRKIRLDKNAHIFFNEAGVDELIRLYKEGSSFPFNAEINKYIATYRFHSVHELDLKVPRWDEDPMQVFASLKEFIRMEDSFDPFIQNTKQHEQFLAEKTKITSKNLIKMLDHHREMLWWREEMRDYSTMTYYLIRRLTLILDQRLRSKQMTIAPEDSFFLTFRELLDFFEGKDILDCQKKIEKNKKFYHSFRNFDKPSKIGGNIIPVVVKHENATVYKGAPCSSGSINGEVSVVLRIEDAYTMKPGTILITKFIDPAWTPVFSKISGLITETGGILSHGAVVSREYGIPAVLSIKGITSNLKTGQRIELNGDTGEVILLN